MASVTIPQEQALWWGLRAMPAASSPLLLLLLLLLPQTLLIRIKASPVRLLSPSQAQEPHLNLSKENSANLKRCNGRFLFPNIFGKK